MKKILQKLLFFSCVGILSFSSVQAQSWSNVGLPGFSSGSASYTSLAIDINGIPYIAFRDDSNDAKATVMKYTNGSWQTVGVPGFSTGVTFNESIITDNSGVPYVVYEDYVNSAALTVMKFNGSSWQIVGTPGFTTNIAEGGSLTLDADGTPYVSYIDNSSNVNAQGPVNVMKYDNSTGTWVSLGSAGTAPHGANTSIKVDGNGTPYVAYPNYLNDYRANVKKYDGTNWITVGSTGFSAASVSNISMALDANNTLYVAYVDNASYYKASVMKYDGSDWVVVGTAGFTTGAAGQPSFAINNDGTPYLAFRDGSDSYKATVMNFNGTSWQTVGTAGFSDTAVLHISLAISSNGIPYVAYADEGHTNKTTVMSYDNATLINNVASQSIQLYPNPAQSTLYITAPQKVNVMFSDITGKELMHVTNATAVNISDLAEGIYIVTVTDEDGIILKKTKVVKIR